MAGAMKSLHQVVPPLKLARWKLVEDLARQDASGLPAVLAFAIKLMLATRWAAMKEEAGRERLEQLVSQLEENAAQSGAASFK